MEEYGMFFAQERPERPITRCIAEVDNSPSYAVDATAVFECEGGGYLVVYVSGCSCWPSRGSTTQTYCETKADVDRAISGTSLACGDTSGLSDALQLAGW